MPDLQQPARTAEEQLAETQQKLAEAENNWPKPKKPCRIRSSSPARRANAPLREFMIKSMFR